MPQAKAVTERRSEAKSVAVVGIVAALTALGAALRLVVVQDSLFADELSTYWIVSTNGLGGVLSTVHSNAEITPPLYFSLAWLFTRVDLTPELVRAPSLLAGCATIPLVYLLGVRTVGRAPALVAAALTALSPFMIFYSAEARGYGLAMGLVVSSTLALLAAASSDHARWWVVYAACSCAAVLTHYTVVFVLGAQLLWLVLTHPEARRAAVLASAGAILAFLPWLSGLIADFKSPTTDILSVLAPLSADSVRIGLEHWAVGYPYVYPSTGLRDLPGTGALVLLAVGIALAVAGAVAALLRDPRRFSLAHVGRGPALIFVLALVTPVGEILVSAVGNNLFGVRNLAASWPAFALALSTGLMAAGPRLKVAAFALVVAAFAIGAVQMLESGFSRPDYEAAGAFVDRRAAPGDVVIDAALVTPGPLGGLDVSLDRPERVFRVGAPEQHDHPFNVSDAVSPAEAVTRRAVAQAGGRRIFVVSGATPATGEAARTELTSRVIRALPGGYREVARRSYPGFLEVAVLVYAERDGR